MKLSLDYQIAVDDPLRQLPDQTLVQCWLEAALCGRRDEAEVAVRVVDETEGLALNRQYRGRAYPTNVLSFPFDAPPGVDLPLLGDIIICAPVVAREAGEQGKPLRAHWAHMIVHGCLHLLGYDHVEQAAAERMEGLETEILLGLGYCDPYGDG